MGGYGFLHLFLELTATCITGRHKASRHDMMQGWDLSFITHSHRFLVRLSGTSHEIWALWCSGSFLIPQYLCPVGRVCHWRLCEAAMRQHYYGRRMNSGGLGTNNRASLGSVHGKCRLYRQIYDTMIQDTQVPDLEVNLRARLFLGARLLLQLLCLAQAQLGVCYAGVVLLNGAI